MKTTTLKIKAMSILLALVLLLGMTPMNAFAAEPEVVKSYSVATLYDDGTLEIFGDLSNLATIPWRSEREQIKNVVFQADITALPESAFDHCTALESIVIPNSVTSIGNFAFNYCNVLSSVTFEGNSSLETIGNNAFDHCTALKSIVIPDSVTSIGIRAFSYCTALESISIPDSITSISDAAFDYCSALKSIVIPASVTSIGNYAFNHCDALTDIYYGGTEAEWEAISKGTNAIPNGVSVICPVGSIFKIEKTGSVDNVDTYTIYYTNGSTSTFTVTNGKDGVDGIQGEKGEDGHSPVITIQNGNWYIDGVDTGKSAEGVKGDTGNGISSIAKTKTEGLVDTYTITYTDGTQSTFTVTNGAQGEQGIQGIQGVPGKDGHTPVITIQDGYWYVDGANTNVKAEGVKGDTGNGISSIEKTGTSGLVDTYTITFTDGSTTTFTVTNGEDGKDGTDDKDGTNGADGLGIANIVIDENGNLIFTMTDGSAINAGKVPTAQCEYEIVGDASGDGKVNIKDATAIQKYLAGLESLTPKQKALADVNADGVVNIKDATAIQKFLAGLESSYTVGEHI